MAACDLNARVGGLLHDLAAVQSSPHKARGYRRAAAAVLALDEQLHALTDDAGTPRKIPGLGPSSLRVAAEVLTTGDSPSAEAIIDASGRRAEVDKRRRLSDHFLSRAEALRILDDATMEGPSRSDYQGDLQMHSSWSDGDAPVVAMALGCVDRGYAYAGITDHSYGLPIARGVSMTQLARQHVEIDQVNEQCADRFRLLKGIEANIAADGTLDLSPGEMAGLEFVLAAPHSRLRTPDDQTARLTRVVNTPGVHVLAHPRGRKAGTRAGISADWPRVFREAARAGVAVELDGDPSRQDLDHHLAREAFDAGCLFAIDSDAHSVSQLQYADIGLAHARLASIPPSRIVNCWSLDTLLAWMKDRRMKG